MILLLPHASDLSLIHISIHGLRLILAGEEGRYRYRTAPDQSALTIRWDRDTVELPPTLSQAEAERWK